MGSSVLLVVLHAIKYIYLMLAPLVTETIDTSVEWM